MQRDTFKSVFDERKSDLPCSGLPWKRQFGAYLDIHKSTSGSLLFPSMFEGGSSLPCMYFKKRPYDYSGRAGSTTRRRSCKTQLSS